MGKIDEKAFDNAISQAAQAAAYLKEKDPRFKTIKTRVSFHTGLLDEKPRHIVMACTGPEGDSFEVVAITKKQAKELIEQFSEYIAFLDKEEREEKEETGANEKQVKIYKKMEYQMRLPEYETLAEGKNGEYEWKVLSLGPHPCGYVSVPKNHPFYGKKSWDIDDKIEVHGGLTFSGKLHGFDGLWFGWDYAHAGDFTFPFTMTGDKRWSTQEIVDECLRAIEQFRSFEEK